VKKIKISGIIISAIYTCIMLYLTYKIYNGLRYRSLDLGIFAQSLHSLSGGKLFYNTVEFQLYNVQTHFGVHFQPILFLLFPLLFLIKKTTYALVVSQTIALGTSVYLAYRLATEELGEKKGVALTILYACNSSLIGINIFEFHPVSLAVPLFLLAYKFLKRGSPLFYIISTLILLTKEDAFLGVISIIAWKILKEGFSVEILKKNKKIIFFAFLALVYGILTIKVIIPKFGGKYIYSSLYTKFSIDRRKLLYFLLFNLTFALLPMLDFIGMLSLIPPWLECLLASRETQTMFGFHYPYMLVPLSFVASLEVARQLKWRIVKKLVIIGILASLATLPIAKLPPEKPNPLIYLTVITPVPGKEASWEAIEIVKGLKGPIYTQPEFYPPLAIRSDVYIYPKNVNPRVILVNLNTYYGRRALKRLRDFKVELTRYKKIFEKDGVIIMLRKD